MNRKAKCYNCGVACTGKLQVQMRMNSEPKVFCECCFEEGRTLKMKDLKKKIKNQKVYI